MEVEQKNTKLPVKTPHLHAKIWMIVTAVVVVISLIAIAFYVGRTFYLKREPQEAPAATSTETSQKPATTEDVAKELKGINLSELKEAVNALKNAFAAF